MDFRTKKCNHSEKGRCLHCLTQQIKVQRKNKEENAENDKCFHPSNMKCLKCMPKMEQNSSKNTGVKKCMHPDYQICPNCSHNQRRESFAYYLQKMQQQCKHKKPCKKCLPPQSRKTFGIDRQCRNHLPYPQAQCDMCMAPTVSINKQIYSHVQKVIVETPVLHQLTQVRNIGILLGREQGEIVYVNDIYFPEKENECLSPDVLDRYETLFEAVGYKQVGLFYASPEITPMNLMMIANFQQYCLTIDKSGFQISKFITLRINWQDLIPQVQCFMISDLVQALHKNRLIFETEKKKDYFQLITAKNDRDSSSPLFLREGIETDILKFREAIVWIDTVFNEEKLFIENVGETYPFFMIQEQGIEMLEMYASIETNDPLLKYRNIQFLLHIDQLFGRQAVIVFLNQFIFQAPQLFIQENLKIMQMKKEQIERDELMSIELMNNDSQISGHGNDHGRRSARR